MENYMTVKQYIIFLYFKKIHQFSYQKLVFNVLFVNYILQFKFIYLFI